MDRSDAHADTVNGPSAVHACRGCDLLQRITPLPPGGKARCVRCDQLLYRAPVPLERPLALTLAAALVFIIANMQPLMALSAVGHHSSTTIIGGALQMWLQGRWATAVLIAFCAVLAPLMYILFLLSVLVPLRRPPAPRWVGVLLHGAETVRPWSMLEVMLLGILVALTKVAELATVVPGVGLYAVGVLVVLFTAIPASLDAQDIWKRVAWAHDGDRSRNLGVASGELAVAPARWPTPH